MITALALNVHYKSQWNFYPETLRESIDKTIDTIYQPINNGVYRSGCAATQEA